MAFALCRNCGEIVPKYLKPNRKNENVFCDSACKYAFVNDENLHRERFWNLVTVNGEDDCWEWKGGKDRGGYGNFMVYRDGKRFYDRSSRFAWYFTYGEIPKGIFVLHKCDNPPCCNPSHLFLGTALDNMQDKVRKGRLVASVGEKNGTAKLCERKVRYIKYLLFYTDLPKTEIGARFGVSPATISKIDCGKLWNHVRVGHQALEALGR